MLHLRVRHNTRELLNIVGCVNGTKTAQKNSADLLKTKKCVLISQKSIRWRRNRRRRSGQCRGGESQIWNRTIWRREPNIRPRSAIFFADPNAEGLACRVI